MLVMFYLLMFSTQIILKKILSLGNGAAVLGVKAVEMEAAALYYLAAQHQVDALAIMTISDSLVNPDEDTTAEERQNTFTDMMKVGLETLIAD